MSLQGQNSDRGGSSGASKSAGATGLRLAEFVSAFSLATDMGTGIPMESMLRVALMSVRLGEVVGLSESELVGAYYLPLLALTGCTAESVLSGEMLGDETNPEMTRDWVNTDFAKPREAIGFVARNIGKNKPALGRAAFILRVMSGVLSEVDRAHCEVALRVSERLDLGALLHDSLWQVYERWDGKGVPNKVKGEALTVQARLLHMSMDVAYAYGEGGTDAAIAMAKHKKGTKFDPRMVEAFLSKAGEVLSVLEADSIWDATLKAEPGDKPRISESQLDSAMKAMADFADLKTPFMSGHSTAVAELAAAAARSYGLPESDVTAVYRAGLVHDVGRVGVSAMIWCKPAPLTQSEWERVRLYPYITERVLARPAALAPMGALAGLHRERLDGSGYHKGLPAGMLSNSARILGAADSYRAMIEPRPYRAALTPDAAAEQLRKDVRSGYLDGDAVSAVLTVAGHNVRAARPERPAGLSDREVEVLRLLTRGLPVQEIASTLVVSKKTVDNHIQHIYNKVGVTTRAAATFFAMENNLLG